MDGAVYDTRAGWQFYVVGVSNSIFAGTFSMKIWVEQAEKPGAKPPAEPKDDSKTPSSTGGTSTGGTSGQDGGTPNIAEDPCVLNSKLPGCVSTGIGGEAVDDGPVSKDSDQPKPVAPPPTDEGAEEEQPGPSDDYALYESGKACVDQDGAGLYDVNSLKECWKASSVVSKCAGGFFSYSARWNVCVCCI